MPRRGPASFAGVRGGFGLVLGVTICVAGGCGSRRPATVSVTGRVLLDGKPVVEAAVIFEPEAGGMPARAITGADGSYTLTTFQPNDGAVAGRYRVGVLKMDSTGIQADARRIESGEFSGTVEVRWELPVRYMAPETSGLSAEVSVPASTIDLLLTTKE